MDHYSINHNFPVTELVVPGKWNPSENDPIVFANSFGGGDSYHKPAPHEDQHVVLGQWPIDSKLMHHQDDFFRPDEDHDMQDTAGGDDSYHASITATTSSEAETTNSSNVLEEWPIIDDFMDHQDDVSCLDDNEEDQGMDDAPNCYTLPHQSQPPLEQLFTNALSFDGSIPPHLDPLHNNNNNNNNHTVVSDSEHDAFDDAASIETIGLPLDERYRVTLAKLEASMKRSQETRDCLTIETSTPAESYERMDILATRQLLLIWIQGQKCSQ